jgi:hypothetical protein
MKTAWKSAVNYGLLAHGAEKINASTVMSLPIAARFIGDFRRNSQTDA